jgi:hypothetical protein
LYRRGARAGPAGKSRFRVGSLDAPFAVIRVDRRPSAVAVAVCRIGTCTFAPEELLGHKGLKAAMIYTHVLNKGGKGVRSPADGL